MDWLLDGDVAIQRQARRDLLDQDRPDLLDRVEVEPPASVMLAARGPDGHWGQGFYQPRWTCSHYTLLELRNLGLRRDHPVAREAVGLILTREKGPDGGVNPAGSTRRSDVCVNGMTLNYASYFGASPSDLVSVVDFLLGQRLPDGGFNCRSNRSGATHSSVHSTTSLIEGITAHLAAGSQHRRAELAAARDDAVEFLLRHRLCRSERTGNVMHAEFTRLHHPTRWYFDILRGLDALRDAGVPYDPRMEDALEILRERRRTDGRWAANHAYPGATHVPNPPAGQPNRWITLMALRVLRTYAGWSAP
jgi:hypothetical protein